MMLNKKIALAMITVLTAASLSATSYFQDGAYNSFDSTNNTGHLMGNTIGKVINPKNEEVPLSPERIMREERDEKNQTKKRSGSYGKTEAAQN